MVEEAVEVVRSGDSVATLEEVEMLVDLVEEEEEEALDPISEAVEEEEVVVVEVHLLPKVSFN